MKTVFVAGIHGVGKSYLCEAVANTLNIPHYGFNGVVIECPNCKAQIRNAKCSEMIIRPEDGALSTPITEESLGRCLWEAIKMWNRRNKKANAEVEG